MGGMDKVSAQLNPQHMDGQDGDESLPQTLCTLTAKRNELMDVDQTRGHPGSSNFVINPAASWPGWLMSLTPLLQAFRTLLQNGVSKQEEGVGTSHLTKHILAPKKLKNSARGVEDAQLHLCT